MTMRTARVRPPGFGRGRGKESRAISPDGSVQSHSRGKLEQHTGMARRRNAAQLFASTFFSGRSPRKPSYDLVGRVALHDEVAS
jgi:hypothetical protein